MNISKLISLSILVSFIYPVGLNFSFFDDMSMMLEGYLLIAFANLLIFWLAYAGVKIYERSRQSILPAMSFVVGLSVAITILWFGLMVGEYIPKGMFWVLEILMKLSLGPVVVSFLMYPWLTGQRITSLSTNALRAGQP